MKYHGRINGELIRVHMKHHDVEKITNIKEKPISPQGYWKKEIQRIINISKKQGLNTAQTLDLYGQPIAEIWLE